MPRPKPVLVKIPPIPSIPETYHNCLYRVQTLLTREDENNKLDKGGKLKLGYLTWGLSLAPAKTSGYQVCPGSTPECRKVCIFTSGRGVYDNIQIPRIARTLAYFEKRDWFIEELQWELKLLVRKALSMGLYPACRMNIYSDIAWENEQWLMDFPIQFYDYTKIVKRMKKFVLADFPENYHLTFSRSEKNERDCKEILRLGGNVAVVFGVPPHTYWSYKVHDGDAHDLRFLDPHGIVGLKAKGKAKAHEGQFVERLLSLDLV